MMDAFEAARTLLAVRNYQDKPVPEASLWRILEAGRLTGSSMNGQPWHFVVVQNRDILRQLGSLLRTGPYVAQAPLAIVVALDHSPYAISDASRAIQSMLLTAWADGLGSNWVGFGGSRPYQTPPWHPDRSGGLCRAAHWLPGGRDEGSRHKAAKSALRSGPSRALGATLCLKLSGTGRRVFLNAKTPRHEGTKKMRKLRVSAPLYLLPFG
jgi:nitroreductase